MAEILGRIARRYAEMGIAVFPCAVRSKVPALSKEEGGHGCLDATTDAETIDRWWRRNPDWNIGIACGEKSGIWVLDVDGPGGEATLAALIEQHGPLPETPEQTTGKGRHIVFRWSEGIGNRGGTLGVREFKKKSPGLDVRGEGGYIVGAPSVHPSGGQYKWHPTRRPSSLPFAEAPAWLLEMIVRPAPADGSEAAPRLERAPEAGRASKYGEKALGEECRTISAAAPGTQDNTLVERAFVIGQLVGGGEIEQGYAQSALVHAGLAMRASREPWTRPVVEDKVRRALQAGMLEPRKAPPLVRPVRVRVPVEGPVPQARTTEQQAPATVTPIRGPRQSVSAEDAWKVDLLLKDDVTLEPKRVRNGVLLLANEPEMRGVFAWNAFAGKTVVARRPPWEEPDGTDWEERALTDADEVKALMWLEGRGVHLPLPVVSASVATAAREAAFNPVEEFFDGLEWDRKARLDTWLSYYLGVADAPFARAVGAKWLIGAVARVYRPGCKMDCVLILEGAQGIGKSTALRTLGTLGGKNYFTDEIHDIGSKDAAMQLQGVLIVEMGELHQLDSAHQRALNAWITRTVDRYRPPYGRQIIEAPRQCVLSGSINPVGNGYLNDPTGARRFWPVTCTAVDIDALVRDREQLWAEAVARFKAGESWWLDAEQIPHAQAEQEARYEIDPLADRINGMLRAEMEIRSSDIMDKLEIPAHQQSPQMQRRITKHMRSVGWHSKQIKRDGINSRWWVAPGAQMEMGEMEA